MKKCSKGREKVEHNNHDLISSNTDDSKGSCVSLLVMIMCRVITASNTNNHIIAVTVGQLPAASQY